MPYIRSNLSPKCARGYIYDAESQLYYCQSRYYDPALGRFLNADAFASTGQGILGNNMFAYCGNNPVNMADPSGEIAIEITVAGVAYLIYSTVSIVLVAYCVNKAIFIFLDEIASRWIYSFPSIIHNAQATTEDQEINTAQIDAYKEHTKNKSNKNRNKHEEGNARRNRDQGGEKKKQKNGWSPNNNKRKVRKIDEWF